MKFPHTLRVLWILDKERRPVEAKSMDVWGRWMMEHDWDRIVAQTKLANDIVLVSTVFLGVNHNHRGKGPPITFETMVFGLDAEDLGSMMHRYSSWSDAEAGHKATVKNVRAIIAKAEVRAGATNGEKP